MAITAKYTEPFSYVDTPEMHERIEAIADREQVSKAQVIRECVALGIEAREARSA